MAGVREGLKAGVGGSATSDGSASGGANAPTRGAGAGEAGVDLTPGERSASARLIRILQQATQPWPALSAVATRMSRKTLGEDIVQFEAVRCLLPGRERIDAAAALVTQAAAALCWIDEQGIATPLHEWLAKPVPTPAMDTVHLGDGPGLAPRLPYRGSLHEGAAIATLAGQMFERHAMTPAACRSLEWVAGRERIDLRGHRFVMLGGGAELAPTEVLLAAGATVLLLDRMPARTWLAARMPATGTLVSLPDGVDLLRSPREALAAMRAFAADGPVHVGAFGYAGGRNREWRIAGVMNAIIRAMPPASLRSVGMYVSPSAPAQACDNDAAVAIRRESRLPWSDRAWRAAGVLRPNLLQAQGLFFTRSVVPVQGASYLAAQYLEKRLAAELIATRGPRGDSAPGARPLVSAQVAGITQTASMNIPAFRACFAGGPALGLESYEPQTTRWMSGLIYLAHLLDADSPVRAGLAAGDELTRANAIHLCQVHGGLYAYPHAMMGTLVRAIVAGLRARPSMLPAVLGSVLRGGR